MPQRIPRRIPTLINLPTNHPANIRQREQNAQTGCALAVGRAVYREPGDVGAGAEEAGGRDEVGGEVGDAGGDGGEEDGVAGDAEGRGEDEGEEAGLVAVGEVGAQGVDEGAPEVYGDDEVLGLHRKSELHLPLVDWMLAVGVLYIPAA